MLQRVIANCGSVCLSVRLSVHYTREPRLNDSRYQNALSYDSFSFLSREFRVHSERVC